MKPSLPNGQVPVLYLDDGTCMPQSQAIFRYICSTYKGRKGEVLYPGNADPMLSFQIDEIGDNLNELSLYALKFIYPKNPDYKDKDIHFTNFIVKLFPD